jgi:hypothetical protein
MSSGVEMEASRRAALSKARTTTGTDWILSSVRRAVTVISSMVVAD